eukprot:TRINITY_DN27253_c0_g1_i1.p1 TRINITY_DN27253_c0_g1~~TRINITY_DN27253_c0_g1_i1.p1  ORF type:complete len:735 (+),score=253.75 TRINITY_DN27253_c0_g1_i1:134-2338(+)
MAESKAVADAIVAGMKTFQTDSPPGEAFYKAFQSIESVDAWRAVRAELVSYEDGGEKADALEAFLAGFGDERAAKAAEIDSALAELGINLAGDDVGKAKAQADALFKGMEVWKEDNGEAFFKALEDVPSAGDWRVVRGVLADYKWDGKSGDVLAGFLEESGDKRDEVEARINAALLENAGTNLAGDDLVGGDGEPDFADEGDAPAPDDEPEPEAAGTSDAAAKPSDAEEDEKCEVCGYSTSQPFCGQTGRPHGSAASKKAAKERAKAGGGGGGNYHPDQFATDRACTACGDGGIQGEDPKQAVYICRECDGKFCETCWEYEHTNQKRAHHERHVLFYECDICAVAGEAHWAGMANPGPHPALWYCEECSMMLCKQHYHDEHKNPDRQVHTKPTFLYPGGEDGPFKDVHASQRVAYGSMRFDIATHGAYIKTPNDLVCTLCNSKDEAAALYICTECDPQNPERLCERCWAIEHRHPARRGHAKKMLLIPCDVCGHHEGRPARNYCQNCELNLCEVCDEAEHRNPARQNHLSNPLYTHVDNPEARAALERAFNAARALPQDLYDAMPEPRSGGPAYPLQSPTRGAASHAPPPALYGSPPGTSTPSPGAGSPHRNPSSPQFDVYGTPRRASSISQSQRGTSQEGVREVSAFHHYRHRLVRLYNKYNPNKLPNAVPQLEEYRGKEDSLIAALVLQYGPEPQEAYPPLPNGWRLVESAKGDLFYIHLDGRKQWARPTVD